MGTRAPHRQGTRTPTQSTLLADLKASQEAIAGLHARVGRVEGEVGVREVLAQERTSRIAAEQEREAVRIEWRASETAPTS